MWPKRPTHFHALAVCQPASSIVAWKDAEEEEAEAKGTDGKGRRKVSEASTSKRNEVCLS